MQYLRIENDVFGFYDDRIHEIRPDDIKVTEEEYKKFFEVQASGSQFRVVETRKNNKSLFDFVEPYTPECIVVRTTKNDLVNEIEKLKIQVKTLEQKINEYKED